MLTSRLERCYNSNNNAPTHAPGFQIDYPPPQMATAGAKVCRNGANQAPLGKEVPPPLPPKMFINLNSMNNINISGNPQQQQQQQQQMTQMMPHPPPNLANTNKGRPLMVTGSGFVLGGQGQGVSCDPDGLRKGPANDGNGTWSGALDFQKASSLLDSHDRFKPERSQRRLVQRMKWSQSRWGRSLAGDLFSYSMGTPTPLGQESKASSSGMHPSYYGHISLPPLPVESESRVSSMTIADVSPRLALKKVLLLYEHAQYKEAATFINRLSVGTFRIILRELPMDVFVEAMPHSLPILEALYAKIYSAEGPRVDLQLLKPEPVIMHMVKFFSREDINATQPNRMRSKDFAGPFTQGCRKILGVIVTSEPGLLKKLKERAKTLDKVVEGMGHHGLVGTMDESLMPLHDALKLEFQRVVETYKGALQKLEELSLSNKTNSKSFSKGPAPINASHQRQLSLRAEDIQERLIKNKSVLNAVEATLDNHCLDILLGILQRRVEVDKEALFQFTQLRKETGDVNNSDIAVVAPLLMRYSRGCKQVLEIMREIGKEVGAYEDDVEEDSSDLSGYHSDSDSAIMTSGNSPFFSPRARFNFLSRSVRSKQGYRPSLMHSHSTWTAANLAKMSGPGSAKSFGGSSFQSSSPDELTRRHLVNPAHAVTPVRPRHVKNKSQLHKNNSLVSNISTAGSDDTSGCGTSLTPSEEDGSLGSNSPSSAATADCVDCITVVSVPDNQVITQGINHHCGKHNPNHSPASTASTVSTTESSETDIKAEVAMLKRQLQSANSTIYHLQEKGRQQGVSGQNPGVAGGLLKKVQIEPPTSGKSSERRADLVREYGALYAQARVETMDALDSLTELNDADELKSKLLFSVVVLAFRSVQSRLTEIKEQVSNLLQFDAARQEEQQKMQLLQPCQSKLVEALSEYLLSSQQKFDQSRCVEHVANQLWSTLYDYPCLRKCDGLLKYITKCVNLAWRLSNQTPPCVLEYETRGFVRTTHVRFHSSDQSSEMIKTYLWPALMEGGGSGVCIHKGVVIT